MTNDELTQLEALDAAATPGPWEERDIHQNSLASDWLGWADAIPALIAEVRRLRGDNARLRAALEAVEWEPNLDGELACPWCYSEHPGAKPERDWYKSDNDYALDLEAWTKRGHRPDCKRQAALAAGEDGEQ